MPTDNTQTFKTGVLSNMAYILNFLLTFYVALAEEGDELVYAFLGVVGFIRNSYGLL